MLYLFSITVFYLLSFFGLGGITYQILKIKDSSIGFQCLGGCILLQITSGFLILANSANYYFYSFFLALGVLYGAYYTFRQFHAYNLKRIKPNYYLFVYLIILCCYLLRINNVIIQSHINPFDDYVSYLPQAKKLLDIGSLIEPYSFRRLASYGGQTSLLAYFLILTPQSYAPLLEISLFSVLFLLLVYDLFKSNRYLNILGHFLIVNLIWLNFNRINLASQLTTAYFLLGATQILLSLNDNIQTRSKQLLFSAALVCFVILRSLNLYTAGLMLISLFGIEIYKRKVTINLFLPFLFFLFLLLPWSLALVASSNTPFFPLISGNLNTQFASFYSPNPLFSTEESIINSFFNSQALLLLSVVIVIAILKPKNKFLIYLLSFNYLSLLYILSYFMVNYETNEKLRYSTPHLYILFIFMILGLSNALIEFNYKNSFLKYFSYFSICWIFQLLMILSQSGIWIINGLIYMNLAKSIDCNRIYLINKNAEQKISKSLNELEEKFKNSTVFVASDNARLLNFTKNNYMLLDIPGHASPLGKMPSFRNPQEYLAYCYRNNISYLLTSQSPFIDSLYSEKKWSLDKFRFDYHKEWAVKFEEYFEFLNWLKENGRVVFEKDGNILYRLI